MDRWKDRVASRGASTEDLIIMNNLIQKEIAAHLLNFQT